jgi:L-asparaginase II
MRKFQLDVVVTRGSDVESRHRVHCAVVDASGALVGGSRDQGLITMWRSCAKPFQVMPLLEAGGFEELAWGDDELALSCASHGGEPEHIAIAESMLRDLGLEEGDLACGPHEPLSPRGSRLAREAGTRIGRLHNNCSGKHAAMLAQAHVGGWSANGYERRDHPVQQAALDAVATWSGVPADKVGLAIDGCGVVVFALPLENMARAFARLGAAMVEGQELPCRIAQAIRTRPFLYGGTDRFDSLLLEETGGAVLPKIGAEGVHTVCIPDAGLAFALKVEDGAQRAQYPAVLRLLQLLGALPERLPARLADFARPRVKSSRGEVVGEVRPIDS